MAKQQTLTSLCEEYARCEDEALTLAQALKPFEDRMKQIRDELFQRFVDEERTSFKGGGLLVQMEQKPASVAWMQEFLKLAGPEAVTKVKSDAGTKQAIKILKV